jgi:hypothetical protein
VTLPGGVLKIARKLIPQRALAALKDQGIDLDEIIRLAEQPEAKGRLVEIEWDKRYIKHTIPHKLR